jgi:putative transposase
MIAVEQLSPLVGVVRACGVLGVNRAGVYRVRQRRCQLAGAHVKPQPRRRPPLALAAVEREALLQVLNSERFADMAPASIYATLLARRCANAATN